MREFKIPLRRDDATKPQQFYVPTILELERWRSDFPNIDIEQHLKEIVAWNENYAHRRKTRRGIRHHVWKWLNRQNEQAPARPAGDNAEARGLSPEEYKRQAELARKLHRQKLEAGKLEDPWQGQSPGDKNDRKSTLEALRRGIARREG